MHRVLPALLLLLCLASGTHAQQLVKNSTYSLKSSSIIQGGGTPSVDLTASQTIGFFKFQFTNPLYFKLDGQCLPNVTCNTQTVQFCCQECLDFNGAKLPNPINPLNRVNCYCAQSVTSVCLDLTGIYSQYSDAARLLNGFSSSSHHGGGTVATGGGFDSPKPLARNEIHYYEFSTLAPCSNLLLTVMSLSGDQNLYANTQTYPTVQTGAVSATDAGNVHHHHDASSDPFAGVVSNSTTQTAITGNISASSISPGYDWYSNAWSTRRLSDSIVFCSTNSVPYTMPNGMDPATYKLNMVNDLGAVSTKYFIAVHGYLPGQYALRFEAAAPAQPQFLLDTVHYYHLAPALRHLHCGEGQYAVYGLPPSADPGFSYFAIQSGEQPLNVSTMNVTLHDDVYAFALDISLTINGVTTVLFNQDLSTCHMNFSHGRVWYDAQGVNVANTEEPFLLENPGCRYESLRTAYEGLLAMISNLSNAQTLDQISQGIMGGAMWSTSDAWLGCDAYVKDGLMLRTKVNNTVASTTRCYALAGTPEYAVDPCCNSSLLFSECCVPRTIPITTERLIPLEDNVLGDCRTDECSVQAATEFAQVANSLSDSRIGCDAVADSVSQDPGFRDTQISECFSRYTAPCTSDADCPTDTTCDTLRGACRYPASDAVIARCAVNGLSPELKIPLKIALNISALATDALLADALYTKFLVTGCNQPLLKLEAVAERDWVSDYNATICTTGGGYCNWDADATTNRANVSCVGTPWRTTEYCFSPARCNDVVPGSCPEASSFPGCFTNLTLSADCTAAGGTFDENERGTMHVCWLSNVTTPASCVDTTLCNAADETCQPFCYVTGATAATCTCALYATSGPYYTICNQTSTALAWDATKGAGQCVVSTAVYDGSRTGCGAVGGTSWYRGGHWQAAVLNDQASCTAAGTCTAAWATNQTACNGATACTVPCVGCTPAQCTSTGACSDTMLAAGGSCVVNHVPDVFGIPTCPSEAGITYTLWPVGCIANGNAINASACAARTDAAWMTPAPDQPTCAATMRCRELRNGAFVYSRKNATLCDLCGGSYESIFKWSTGVASAAVWTANVWGTRRRTSANTPNVQLWNSTAAQAAIANVFLARYAQLAKTFLACQYGGVASYLSLLSCDCASGLAKCYSAFQPVLLGVTRLCSGAVDSVLLAPAELNTDAANVFASGCANLQVSLIPAGRFRRGSANIYSSLFLDSIQSNEWAVIENSKKVVVGQLIGNGIQFQMDTTAQPGVLLCIELRGDISPAALYDTFDFAELSANFKTFKVFGATNATLRLNSAGVPSVCAPVTQSGNYFPIKRFANAKSAKFSDTLTSAQKTAFWVGMAIYIVCWLCATYRLASLFLWTLIRPTDSTGQVKTAHPLMVPRIAMALLCAFFFLRWLYFILVPAGVMLRAPLIIDILMAELPTYFFITIFSLLVLWWVELYHRSSARKNFLGRMKWVFIGVNVVLYLFLLIVIIVYAVTENDNNLGVCSTASRSTKKADTVAKVYKVFVSVIALILASGFMIYGIRLFLMVVGVSGSLDRIVKFVLISTICSLGLLLQCALLLYSTFKPSTRRTDTALAIAFTLVVEVLPGLVLIAFMRQPELLGLAWYQDLVWCLYADRDIAVSGAGASKSFQSSKRSAGLSGTASTGASAGASSGSPAGSGHGSDLAVGPSQSASASRY